MRNLLVAGMLCLPAVPSAAGEDPAAAAQTPGAVCGDPSGGNFATCMRHCTRDPAGAMCWEYALHEAFRAVSSECIRTAAKPGSCGYFETTDDIFAGGIPWTPGTHAVAELKQRTAELLAPYSDALGLTESWKSVGMPLLRILAERIRKAGLSECQQVMAATCFTGQFIDYAFSIHGAGWSGIGHAGDVIETRKGICADFARVAYVIMRDLGLTVNERCQDTHCVNAVQLKKEGNYFVEPQSGQTLSPFYAYIDPQIYERCNGTRHPEQALRGASEACAAIAADHRKNRRWPLWIGTYERKAACFEAEASAWEAQAQSVESSGGELAGVTVRPDRCEDPKTYPIPPNKAW